MLFQSNNAFYATWTRLCLLPAANNFKFCKRIRSNLLLKCYAAKQSKQNQKKKKKANNLVVVLCDGCVLNSPSTVKSLKYQEDLLCFSAEQSYTCSRFLRDLFTKHRETILSNGYYQHLFQPTYFSIYFNGSFYFIPFSFTGSSTKML